MNANGSLEISTRYNSHHYCRYYTRVLISFMLSVPSTEAKECNIGITILFMMSPIGYLNIYIFLFSLQWSGFNGDNMN